MADDSIPSPPENPFESSADNPSLQMPDEMPEETLPQQGPNVAAKPGKVMLVLAIVGGLILFLLYSIAFGGKKEDAKPVPKEVKVEKREIEPPPLPELEDISANPTPPPITAPDLPEPVDMPEINDVNVNPLAPKEDAAQKAQEMARMKSSMMVVDGGANQPSVPGGLTPPGQADPTDANSLFASRAAATKVQTVAATRIADLNRTIAQGRVIHATLETAINTDLSAPIRAIVSRDTYGEAGVVPLIPKGSRLIGTYNSTLTSGQTRVLVIWTRVIRPDGIDVMLGSPLVDTIGQAGVSGQIDTKFQEIFSRALLSSVVSIAMAIGSEKLSDNTSVTTTGSSTQTTGGGAQEATTNALNKLGSITDSFIQRFINVPPTILIDQGKPVNVMVNKDLVFPTETSSAAMVQ
jgi:type IV secretion system protein VirB10